jgi:hypothetical protein
MIQYRPQTFWGTRGPATDGQSVDPRHVLAWTLRVAIKNIVIRLRAPMLTRMDAVGLCSQYCYSLITGGPVAMLPNLAQ